MMRHTPGEAIHMLERAGLLSIIKKDLLNCNRIRNAVPMSKLALARRKATLDSLPRFEGGSRWKDSGDNRLSRQSTTMGLAGLTAAFGIGTGVTAEWGPSGLPMGKGLGPLVPSRRQS